MVLPGVGHLLIDKLDSTESGCGPPCDCTGSTPRSPPSNSGKPRRNTPASDARPSRTGSSNSASAPGTRPHRFTPATANRGQTTTPRQPQGPRHVQRAVPHQRRHLRHARTPGRPPLPKTIRTSGRSRFSDPCLPDADDRDRPERFRGTAGTWLVIAVRLARPVPRIVPAPTRVVAKDTLLKAVKTTARARAASPAGTPLTVLPVTATSLTGER